MMAADLVAHVEANGLVVSGHGPWMAQCPCHDDHSPSLSITQAADRTLVHCFGGCSPQEVVGALGLRMRDLFADAANSTPTRTLRSARVAHKRAQTPRPREVDSVLEAFRSAGMSWRGEAQLGTWRAECPCCHDPRLSVWVIDYTFEEGREGEPALVFCANACPRQWIARALQQAKAVLA
jgi:hypothetical protein